MFSNDVGRKFSSTFSKRTRMSYLSEKRGYVSNDIVVLTFVVFVNIFKTNTVPNKVLVPPAGLKTKELFRGVATCFGLRDMSEVDSQKVS